MRVHTWSVPTDLWGSDWGSGTDPPRTATGGQKQDSIGFFPSKDSKEFFFKHTPNNLLQGDLTQLDGDVSEEAVPLRTEISDDVGVRVRLSQQLHFPLGHLETLGQDPLDGDGAPVEFPPEFEERVFIEALLSLSQEQRHSKAC